jgi:hypothetical protein
MEHCPVLVLSWEDGRAFPFLSAGVSVVYLLVLEQMLAVFLSAFVQDAPKLLSRKQ